MSVKMCIETLLEVGIYGQYVSLDSTRILLYKTSIFIGIWKQLNKLKNSQFKYINLFSFF